MKRRERRRLGRCRGFGRRASPNLVAGASPIRCRQRPPLPPLSPMSFIPPPTLANIRVCPSFLRPRSPTFTVALFRRRCQTRIPNHHAVDIAGLSSHSYPFRFFARRVVHSLVHSTRSIPDISPHISQTCSWAPAVAVEVSSCHA